MKRVEPLISLIRERTRNTDYSVDASGVIQSGISDDLIIQFLNEAQDHLQAAILSMFPSEFVEQKVISIVANQESYSIPDNLFANNKIISVEYKSTNSDADYWPLDMVNLRDRDTSTGYPKNYIRRSGNILLNPIPSNSSGTIRVSYYRELDNLDKRRGVVSSYTATATNLTALTLDTTSDDAIALAAADYLCINTRLGVPTMYNIPITAYNTTSGVVTLADVITGYAFPSGSTIANGYYVTIGRYSTTHSKLPDICERYLLLYAQKRILSTDANQTSMEEDADLKAVEANVMSIYAEETKDVAFIPVLDNDIFY